MDWKRIVSFGRGFPFAIACVAAATIVLSPLRGVLQAPTLMLLFVPVIIGVAAASGVQASATAAIVAFLLLDFTFTPPYYRLEVATSSAWIGLLVFLVVALIAGRQSGRLRVRERGALRRQGELELLNRLSFSIASEKSALGTGEFVAGRIAEVLGSGRAALYVGAPGADAPRCVAQAGLVAASPEETALVSWVMSTGKAVGAVPSEGLPYDQRIVSVGRGDALPGVVAEGVYLPLLTSTSLEGVLFVRLPSPDRPTVDDMRLLAAVANLAASSLERQRLLGEAAHVEALREADRLKTTFVSSVSHELKTPLAAATARVTGLVEEGEGCDAARVHEELTAVADDLGRLNNSIGDLLDLSRLESDAWQPLFEYHEVRDILGTVLSRLPAAQRERVHFDLADRLPTVHVDFAQFARAITNLVENALAYSPPQASVTIGAARRDGDVDVWVEDHGPGVADEEKARVFDKFYRGAAAASAPAGTGLGLAIAQEIARSHEGSLRIEDVVPYGARFVLTLPAGPEEEEL
jgi:two-component system, OmpR family, sensor histidine kinase KdpD